MFDYVESQQDALGLLVEFKGADPGMTFTHIPKTPGAPGSSGPVIGAPVVTWAVGLIFDYSDKSAGDGTMPGTLIRAGDKQAYVAAITPAGVVIPAPVKLDKCVAPDGLTYNVENVKPLGPAGTVCLYEIQLRK